MAWRCFMVRESNRYEHSFRRFGGHCERVGRLGYHNAEVALEIVTADNQPVSRCFADHEQRLDPRWPTKCECGYEFTAQDHWQVNFHPLWRADDGREWKIRDFPVGAMYYAPWLAAACENLTDPNGCLCVVTPAGYEWPIDAPARTKEGGVQKGNGWTRTGTPPMVTASPSIAQTGYHGFLQNGCLTDDCEGRTFPNIPATA